MILHFYTWLPLQDQRYQFPHTLAFFFFLKMILRPQQSLMDNFSQRQLRKSKVAVNINVEQIKEARLFCKNFVFVLPCPISSTQKGIPSSPMPKIYVRRGLRNHFISITWHDSPCSEPRLKECKLRRQLKISK
jgi:hypothetical protein